MPSCLVNVENNHNKTKPLWTPISAAPQLLNHTASLSPESRTPEYIYLHSKQITAM